MANAILNFHFDYVTTSLRLFACCFPCDDYDDDGDDDDDGGGGGKGFVNHLAPLLASPLDLAPPLLPGPGGAPPPRTILLALSG